MSVTGKSDVSDGTQEQYLPHPLKPKLLCDFGQSIMDFGETSFGPLDG